jgi:hypothetical protein
MELKDAAEHWQKGAIAKAVSAAMCEVQNPKFDSQNPHFRNSFASLASVRNAVVPVFARHEVCITQNLETTADGKGIACTTILTHSSGQQMVFGPLVMPASKPDSQGLGSAATYARRYALMAVCGVVGDEDDDANSATGKPAAAVKPGIGVHDPMGDAANPTTTERLYASNFIAAYTKNDIDRAIAIHSDLHEEGEITYRKAWNLLDSKTRAWIKKALEASKVMTEAAKEQAQ